MHVARTLVVSLALGIAAGHGASAQVGVTSATAGDPLGQPPAQNERVLRVGIDVVANERVTTRSDDRAHLVFLDGTSLTVGPNSALAIDKYVFDPDRKVGEVTLSATKGVLRLVGGSISKTGEMRVTTPSASIGIRGGIATIHISETGGTTATFQYGQSMTVSGQGQTQTATRAGSQIRVDFGRPPGVPTIIPPRGEVTGAIIEKASAAPAAAAPVVAVATPTVAIATPVVPIVQPVAAPVAVTPVVSIAAVDQALETSQISIVNSKVSIASLIDDDGPRGGQQGQRQGRSSGPGRGQGGGVPKIANVLRLSVAANRAIAQHAANTQQQVVKQNPSRR